MNTLITTDDGEILEVSTSMIEQQSEHSMKVSTAKRFPRSLKTFRSQVLELSTLDEDSAASMFYVLPRGKKNIEGPSIRFAELVATAYGNLSYAARIIDEQERFIVAQGVCYDYERNLSVAIEVRLRITNSNGDRYNDDMIQVTGRAACARALREAIFKVVIGAAVFLRMQVKAAREALLASPVAKVARVGRIPSIHLTTPIILLNPLGTAMDM